jgi:hypothetical protein
VRYGNNNVRLDNKDIRHNGVEKGKTTKIRKSTETVRAVTARDVTSPAKFLCLAAFVRANYAVQPTRSLFREKGKGKRRRTRRIWLP